MAVCIFIGLFYEWKIGLVVFAFVPFVMVAKGLEAKIVKGHMHKENKGMEGASKVTMSNLHIINNMGNSVTVWQPILESMIFLYI